MFADGHIHRRHKCVHCGSGFKTVEIKREDYEKMIAQVNDFEKIKQLLTLNKE
jgi:transcriptional regulator NrdR family protein